MWHGWAAAIVPPTTTIDNYEAVEQHISSREATEDFLRLCMIPGMDRCGALDVAGITFSGLDPLTALERWLVRGGRG